MGCFHCNLCSTLLIFIFMLSLTVVTVFSSKTSFPSPALLFLSFYSPSLSITPLLPCLFSHLLSPPSLSPPFSPGKCVGSRKQCGLSISSLFWLTENVQCSYMRAHTEEIVQSFLSSCAALWVCINLFLSSDAHAHVCLCFLCCIVRCICAFSYLKLIWKHGKIIAMLAYLELIESVSKCEKCSITYCARQ